MADYFVATSEDGIRFKLKSDGTWEPDMAIETEKDCIRFRSCNWGASVAQVKEAEETSGTELIAGDEQVLIYGSIMVAGFIATTTTFSFVNGLLCAGRYHFKQGNLDSAQFIDVFNRALDLYTKKYGPPDETQDHWLNDRFRDDCENRGRALTCGDLNIRAMWQDNETEIVLFLSGGNLLFGGDGPINLHITYESKQLKSLADAARENEMMAEELAGI